MLAAASITVSRTHLLDCAHPWGADLPHDVSHGRVLALLIGRGTRIGWRKGDEVSVCCEEEERDFEQSRSSWYEGHCGTVKHRHRERPMHLYGDPFL